ncbi:MAG: hypothetical protein KG003_13950 [Bacteroidetes bacterium]|nr:hypothetical protein [Bacteroidota bacterium]
MNLIADSKEFRKDLHRSIEQVTAQLVKDFADEVPEQLRALIDDPPPSRTGSPPAKRSGTLQRTLRAYVVGPTAAEIEFENYVAHLDPIFEGEHDRPFIERGIAKTLEELG